MKSFFVVSYGYECHPEFATLAEARAFLKNSVAGALQSAKRRGHKQARKHKLAPDCYRITLGSDPQSALWAHISITPA